MSAHLEVAKEYFLELVCNGAVPRDAARRAIEVADVFDEEYSKHHESQRTSRGCKACYGSGGKRNAPCKVCSGTGKVAK